MNKVVIAVMIVIAIACTDIYIILYSCCNVGERSLHDILIKERVKEKVLIQSYTSALLTAVAHMHEKGFIHGDLKVLYNITFVCAYMTFPCPCYNIFIFI